MKKLIAIIVLGIVLTTSSTAYAGDAWPWVVGGLAGAALLTNLSHRSSHHTNHVYYTPSYYPTTTYTYPTSYGTYWNPYRSDIVYGSPYYGGYSYGSVYCGY